jgi:hypothetical protein
MDENEEVKLSDVINQYTDKMDVVAKQCKEISLKLLKANNGDVKLCLFVLSACLSGLLMSCSKEKKEFLNNCDGLNELLRSHMIKTYLCFDEVSKRFEGTEDLTKIFEDKM